LLAAVIATHEPLDKTTPLLLIVELPGQLLQVPALVLQVSHFLSSAQFVVVVVDVEVDVEVEQFEVVPVTVGHVKLALSVALVSPHGGDDAPYIAAAPVGVSLQAPAVQVL